MNQSSEQKCVFGFAREDQARAIKTIGERMRRAREMSNLTQLEAAKRMGFANSSRLAKVEKGTDISTVPSWMIVRASQLYGVSIDFLYGQSEDWERDPVRARERAIADWMLEVWGQARARDLEGMRALFAKVTALERQFSVVLAQAAEAEEVMGRVEKLNPDVYQELRLGALLSRHVANTAGAAREGKRQLERVKVVCELASPATRQMALGLFE